MHVETVRNFGTPPSYPLMKYRMEAAGFVEAQEHVLKISISPWPLDERVKSVGAVDLVNMVEGIETLLLGVFAKALGCLR